MKANRQIKSSIDQGLIDLRERIWMKLQILNLRQAWLRRLKPQEEVKPVIKKASYLENKRTQHKLQKNLTLEQRNKKQSLKIKKLQNQLQDMEQIGGHRFKTNFKKLRKNKNK